MKQSLADMRVLLGLVSLDGTAGMYVSGFSTTLHTRCLSVLAGPTASGTVAYYRTEFPAL